METERPRGILSEADREHLKTPEKRSRAARHKRQEAIPKRLQNAILDASLLWEYWDDSARRDLFAEHLDDPEFRDGIVDLLALIYTETRGPGRFEILLERAVRKAELETYDGLNSVNVNIEVEPLSRIDVEDILRRYGRPGSVDLSDEEFASVARSLRNYNRQKALDLATEAYQSQLNLLDDPPELEPDTEE